MRNPIFLNSIQVYGLFGVNIEKTFIRNDIVETVNHIRITNDDEADMWSTVIELLTSISDEVIYPTSSEEDWIVILIYSEWDTPLDAFDKPFKTVQVKIESVAGEISEEAHIIRNGIYEVIDNDNHQFPTVSKLDPRIINDISKLNFYRWNPRLSNLDCVYDYSTYFLKFHEKWYKENSIEYREEMEAVLHSLRDGFESLTIVSGEYHKAFNIFVTEKYSEMEISLDRMDDDFQNFFLAYGEFKFFKDYQAGTLGFYMLDCKSKLYISILTSMLVSAFEKSQSQFFFMYWDDQHLDKLEKVYISQMNY